MHEISIARNIIDIVSRSLSPEEFNRAEEIKVRLGFFSNVLPEALQSSFDVLKNEFNLQNVSLMIETIPLKIICQNCGSTIQTTESVFKCPFCTSPYLDIIDGDVLDISEIILSENQ